MKVLIDDIREIEGMDFSIREPETAIDFVLMNGGKITELFMDHDLGSDKITGYDILKYVIEACNFRPNKVILVTNNPVGRSRMRQILERAGYYAKCGDVTTYVLSSRA